MARIMSNIDSHPKPSSYSGILTHKKRKSMKRKNRVTLKNGAPR